MHDDTPTSLLDTVSLVTVSPKCPKCQARLPWEAAEHEEGQKIECGGCGAVFNRAELIISD